MCKAIDDSNNEITVWHYLIVIDLPHVTLEYAMVYEVPMCEELLMLQKAENLRELVVLSIVTKHHGLVYSIDRFKCEYFENKMFSLATFYVTCESREPDFRESCDTVECYLKSNSEKLLNASWDSSLRWYEVEAHPGKYPLRLSKLIKMPEFRIVKEPLKHQTVLKCLHKYILWKELLCLPCLSGHFYNNLTNNCTKCPLNTFQPFEMMSECFSCLPSWITKGNGSKGFKPCIKPPNATAFFVKHHGCFIISITLIFFILILISAANNKYAATQHQRMQKESKKADEKLWMLVKERPAVLKDYPGATNICMHHSQKPIIEVDRVEFIKEAQKRRKKIPTKFKKYVFAA